MAGKKVAIVAVETNLIGRTVVPMFGKDEDPHGAVTHLWPWARAKDNPDRAVGGTVIDYREDEAEIVAVYVGDLGDGGTIKFVAMGKKTGELHEMYRSSFKMAPAWAD